MSVTSESAPRRAQHDAWEEFVRETIISLQGQVDVGDLHIDRRDSGGLYMVTFDGSSSRIAIPTHNGCMLPPPANDLKRSPKDLLSPYTIERRCGSPVNVPHSAITRDHGRLANRLDVSPIQGTFEYRRIDPASIIVIRMLMPEGWVFGWYLRFDDAPRVLERVPMETIQRLCRIYSGDRDMRDSRLMWECLDIGKLEALVPATIATSVTHANFNEQACDRFARFRLMVTKEVNRNKKRKHCPDPEPVKEFVLPRRMTSKVASLRLQEAAASLFSRPMEPAKEEAAKGTCLICLEEHGSANVRCRQNACSALICDDCHSSTRGLCPICDRTAINADYPCSSCGYLHPLRKHGFECLECKARTLCSGCYSKFGSCLTCDSASALAPAPN